MTTEQLHAVGNVILFLSQFSDHPSDTVNRSKHPQLLQQLPSSTGFQFRYVVAITERYVCPTVKLDQIILVMSCSLVHGNLESTKRTGK